MGSPDRIAYFNGRFVPEREVLVPFRDRGFKYGDAVFDTTRTFGHRIFKLGEHVDRLYRSLRYLRIDPGIAQGRMVEITEEVLRRNLSLLEPDDDYWVTQRVSRGLDASAREVWPQAGATVIVECLPLPLRAPPSAPASTRASTRPICAPPKPSIWRGAQWSWRWSREDRSPWSADANRRR